MILEGVSALRREFRDCLSLTIFVDTPLEVAVQRGVAREIASGSPKTKKEIEAQWKEWGQGELSYFNNHSPMEYADIVVSGEVPFDRQFDWK